MRIFIVAAVILTVFAIIGTATHSGTCLGVSWYTWLSAGLLAFFVDLLFGWTWALPLNRPGPG